MCIGVVQSPVGQCAFTLQPLQIWRLQRLRTHGEFCMQWIRDSSSAPDTWFYAWAPLVLFSLPTLLLHCTRFWHRSFVTFCLFVCLLVCFFGCFFIFRDKISLCSPGCSGAHSGLELRNPSASASQVVVLKVCATTALQSVYSHRCLSVYSHKCICGHIYPTLVLYFQIFLSILIWLCGSCPNICLKQSVSTLDLSLS